ncbi:KTSC domain-containing protein [Sinorhizobium sp. BJ1]|uniref:KTSC domain-containing protein n=1 Tax=Sinorhizobium sp. BJ1 TaxID=2035455 RepID=UPI000BE7BD69|nr:KTSC domain-containing protein [Sinorhizobium sp. BJ1]PDT81988.1 KTSC domain-containing protein [Sinorhizobium sp. BJ1]
MPLLQSFLDSSAIRQARYDAPRRILSIWFVGNDRPYHYLDVPERVYEELADADSAGGYFNHRIRDHYDFVH